MKLNIRTEDCRNIASETIYISFISQSNRYTTQMLSEAWNVSSQFSMVVNGTDR